MSAFALIWAGIKSLFTKQTLGVLWKVLFTTAGTLVMQKLSNVDLQQKAYEYVKELNANTELTSEQKRDQFNEKLLAYAKAMGVTLGNSLLNTLRELAVSAVKSELDKAS